ncbi:MAG: TolC family protein, partial [Clostridia bacterium]|nr:TolC family protein [Clostridia bacterium]
VAQAEEALRLARLRYEVGMATRLEVQAAELMLAQAEAAAASVLRQHAYYKLAFQKPWAVAGSTAGTTSGGSQRS